MTALLERKLPLLLEFLQELGRYQLRMQGKVRTQTKSSATAQQAWTANQVFSEVDVHSEERLLAFWRQEFGAMPVISEELNSDGELTSAEDELMVVIDPLDGTKPYLEGKQGFGISLGVLRAGRFLFGINHYPALDAFLYTFADAPGVMDGQGHLLPVPHTRTQACYVASGFNALLDPDWRHPGAIDAATGVRVGDYDRCATYIFKRIIEGETLAYLSIEPYLWDLGPSSLLLEKSGCGMFDLGGRAVDFAWLSRPPFCQPAVVALPVIEKDTFLSALQPLLLNGSRPT